MHNGSGINLKRSVTFKAKVVKGFDNYYTKNS